MADKRIAHVGIGCLVLVVAGAIVIGIGWGIMMSLTNQAVETRQTLDDTYASQGEFTPFLDGSIPPERLDRFLAIRQALMVHCETFSVHQDAFRRLEGLEDAEEEPAAGDLVTGAKAASASLWRMGHDVGKYAIARNQTLLENEMGLGEYTWIYVIVYFAWLENRPTDFVAEGDDRTKIFHGRVLGEVRDMMQRYVDSMEAALVSSGAPSSPGLQNRLAVWRSELDALYQDETRIPFQDGMPTELETSLVSFRDALEEVHCPATGELEIMRTEATRGWYDHR